MQLPQPFGEIVEAHGLKGLTLAHDPVDVVEDQRGDVTLGMHPEERGGQRPYEGETACVVLASYAAGTRPLAAAGWPTLPASGADDPAVRRPRRATIPPCDDPAV